MNLYQIYNRHSLPTTASCGKNTCHNRE